MKSKAAGCGLISAVISSIVLLCISSIIIIVTIIIIIVIIIAFTTTIVIKIAVVKIVTVAGVNIFNKITILVI